MMQSRHYYPAFLAPKFKPSCINIILVFFLVCAPIYADQKIPVSVVPVQKLAIFPELAAPATVISLNDSQLSSQLQAVITSLPIEVGQIVTDNTVLVVLDSADLELALARAKATLASYKARYELAKNRLKSAEPLASRGSLSKDELFQRQTELAFSKAELEAQNTIIKQLQRDIEKTKIRAPFEAIVMEHLGAVGELAMPGTHLVRILDIENIQIVSDLQSSDIESLRQVERGEFITNGIKYPVKLYSVIRAIDLRERSQEVRLKFIGESALIGSSGEIVWRAQDPHLPADLLVRRGNDLGVFTVSNDKAKFVLIESAQEGRPANISHLLVFNSLSESSLIIKDGRFIIQDGDNVQITSQ